jgi:hypothetical protein
MSYLKFCDNLSQKKSKYNLSKNSAKELTTIYSSAKAPLFSAAGFLVDLKIFQTCWKNIRFQILCHNAMSKFCVDLFQIDSLFFFHPRFNNYSISCLNNI